MHLVLLNRLRVALILNEAATNERTKDDFNYKTKNIFCHVFLWMGKPAAAAEAETCLTF